MWASARAILFFCALVSFAVTEAAEAQTADGNPGWTSSAGPAGVFATAEDACRAQWQKYGMDNGYSRLVGAFPSPDDWTHADCKWTSYQWLCPQETGGGLGNCWTVLPSYVQFGCASGYDRMADGHCRVNAQTECPVCAAGKVNKKIGKPILLRTGAKILDAVDYESADGQFRIGRHYRSFQVGRPIDSTVLPKSTPRGLTGGWNFDFGHEIQLGTFSGSPSSPTAKVAILLPDGTGFGFVLQSNGQWISDPALGTADSPKDLKLEFVGTLPANLADVKSASSTWKLTDGDDTVWTLQTRVGPNGGSYDRGWANQMAARDGYTWNFAYKATAAWHRSPTASAAPRRSHGTSSIFRRWRHRRRAPCPIRWR